MRGRKDARFYLVKAAQGALISIFILIVIFIYRGEPSFLDSFLLHETLPGYNMNNDINEIFKNNNGANNEPEAEYDFIEIIESSITGIANKNELTDNVSPTDGASLIPPANGASADIEKSSSAVDEELPFFKITELESTKVETMSGLIGLDDVIYQPETITMDEDWHFSQSIIIDRDKLTDMDYLLKDFYLVDKATGIPNGLIDPNAFLEADLSLKKGVDGPQVLIFHTHSQELFKDSNGIMEGVVGAGEYLCQILESKYGIKTIHDASTYDLVDGSSHILGAYERMEPNIMKILQNNPTIEVAIDMHRDGVAEDIHLVSTINGKPTAQIMFFNGLSTLNENGALREITSLPNSNLKSNMAFSFQMQLAANQLYEGFTRKVYLQAYRYSLHMLPKSLLIEVGAQTNTKEEAFNAMEPLADVLARVVLGR